MKKNNEILTLKMAEVFSIIYFAMILALLPLYFDTKVYTAMINAKGDCYLFIAAVMGIFILITAITSLVRKEPLIRFTDKNKSPMDLAMLAFCGTVVISFLLSENKRAALFGTGGFHVGTLSIVTLVGFYFFVSRNLQGSKKHWDLIILLNLFIFAWVVMDTISANIFGMRTRLGNQKFQYFGSLGQMDSVSAYVCIILPVVIVFFLNQKKIKSWLSVCVLFGLMAFTGIRTDGVYIGVAVCAIFLIPYALKDGVRLVNLLWLGLIWGVAITFYSVLSVVAPDRIGTDMGVSGTLIHYWIGAVMIVFCGLLLLWIEKKRVLPSNKVINVLSKMAVIILLLVIAVFILHGTVNLIQGDIGWGNGRGGIWLGAIHLFDAYNPLQKLFGLGMTAAATDLTYYAVELLHWENIMVANAHNDFLEYLISTGLVGLVAYTATWVVPIVEYIKKKKSGKEWSVAKVAYFMSLMAYLGQSVVGNPYSLSVPIIYLIFALYRNEDFA